MKIGAFVAGTLGLVAACSGENNAKIGEPPAPVTETAPASPEGEVTDTPAEDLTLSVEIEGAGAVRSEPAGIACPGKCSARFAKDAVVTLRVEAAEGWKLDAFSGSCTGTTCELTLADDRTVKATLSLLDPRWDPSAGDRACAAAWGKDGADLSPCDKTKDDYVVVQKSKRNVALCKSGSLVRNFRAGLGFTPTGSKEKEGDGRTPEGVFFVPRVIPSSEYHRALLLSYPTRDDATRGFAAGLVSASERNAIIAAHDACKEPPQYTSLGGLLELNGGGSSDDWTAGSIALEDADMDEVWKTVAAGDTVVVLP